MRAFEPGKRLRQDQLPPFIQLIQRLDAMKYETLALRQQAPELAAIMQLACPDDTAMRAMTAELNEWVCWYRAPGYCLAYLFQLVTMKAGSSAHIAAALLFADAQVGIAEDEAMLSLEVAWETLNKIIEAYPDSADGLERVRKDLISRLRQMHQYYASYSRPLDYLTVHPVFYSLNSDRIWTDLRIACPKETEAVASAASTAEKSAAFERLIAELESRGDTYHWLTARRVAAVDRDSQGHVSEAEVDIAGCLRDARQFGLEAEIGHLLRIHAWQLTALGQFDAAGVTLERRLTAPDGKEARSIAERRRLLEWRIVTASQNDMPLFPWSTNALARARIAQMRAAPREEDVDIAILRKRKLPLEPPEGRP